MQKPAKKACMRTIYIRRRIDDIHEDMDAVSVDHDFFLGDMNSLAENIKSIDPETKSH
jgi:hypothetical protein